MSGQVILFGAILAFFWFILYWILGGVFFATVALMKLSRLKKVRFSCLFSLAALLSAIGASATGIHWAKDSIVQCVRELGPGQDGFVTTFTCGFFGIMSGVLLWAAVLVLVGFLALALSRRRERTWLMADGTHPEEGEGTGSEAAEESDHDTHV